MGSLGGPGDLIDLALDVLFFGLDSGAIMIALALIAAVLEITLPDVVPDIDPWVTIAGLAGLAH